MRILAGMLAGGIFPIGIAIVGDLVPVDARQVAIGRVLAVGLTGNLIGATISGVISDLLGWRAVFFSIGAFGLVVANRCFLCLSGVAAWRVKAFQIGYSHRRISRHFSRSACQGLFGSVFFEAIIIHGMFPFVAVMLLASGAARSSLCGHCDRRIRGGGILFSLLLPSLVAHVTQRHMMLAGAVFACIAFVLISAEPYLVSASSGVPDFGFGFYNAAQLYSAPRHRSDADGRVARRCRCIRRRSFLAKPSAQSIMAMAFEHFGLSKPPLVGAVGILIIGLVCGALLRHRRDVPLPSSST